MMNMVSYRNKERDGTFQAYLMERPMTSLPDASYAVDSLFGSEARDFARDPLIHRLGEQGVSEFDLDKRKAIYRELFDRINREAYMLPFSTLPQVYLHTKEVKVQTTSIAPVMNNINDLGWK